MVLAGIVGLLIGRFLFVGPNHDGDGAPAFREQPGRSAEAQIVGLQKRLRQSPDDTQALTRLAVAYLARYRETADPGFLSKATQAVERSMAIDPAQPATMTAAGLVSLARHDFDAALSWGLRAHAATPDAPDPLGVVVDARVELGQYAEAAAAAQEMVDRRPSIASLARASYLRELHGDQAGAVLAMSQAAIAGSGAPSDVAAVEVLLGDLHLANGDLATARRAYEQARTTVPGYSGADAGLAKLAAAGGDVTAAVSLLEPVAQRLPMPAWVALLGDLYQALGQEERAASQFDLARQIEELNRSSGVSVDLELARFEADHARNRGGRPDHAVTLAAQALSQRPTVFAEDVYGWALRQAGRPDEALPHARSAVRMGTADGLLWYHLAAIEADLGLTDQARADLATALAFNRFLTVRDLPAAQALATDLGLPLP